MKNRVFAVILSALMLSAVACGCSGRTIQTNSSGTLESSTIPVQSDESSEQSSSVWSVKHYVDEFKDETDEKYVSAIFHGTFSNSATSGSDLMVKVLVDDDPSISFMLYEYGYNQVKFNGNNIKYKIVLKLDNGTKRTYDGYIADGNDRIYITGSNYTSILSSLNSEENRKVYIEVEDVLVSTYNFDMDTKGFKDKFNEL